MCNQTEKNKTLNEYEMNNKVIKLRSSPVKFQLSPTEKCNLDCFHCYRKSYQSSLNKNDMELNFIENDIVKNVAKFALEGWIVSGGEAFLYNNFFELTKFFEEYDVKEKYTITNGTIYNKKIEAAIFDNKINNIKISIDGATKDTVDFIRGRGVYKKIIKNIETINRIKKSKNLDHPNIIFNFVIMSVNHRELTDLVRLSNDLGIKQIEVHTCQDLNDNTKNMNSNELKLKYKKSIDNALSIANELGVNLLYPDIMADEFLNEDGMCSNPWDFFFITQEGDVYPCCHLWGNPFGNIKIDTFDEIWNGKSFMNFRKDFSEGNIPSLCLNSECPKINNKGVKKD